jgi:hypothetical protein
LVALAFVVITANVAKARSAYDGRWSLSIITERGTCSTYNFPVDIANGHVSFPGLVRARGHVTRKGSVHVTVAVQDKYAAGSGRLSLGSGHGRWYGRSGSDRCSGSWTAQRS